MFHELYLYPANNQQSALGAITQTMDPRMMDPRMMDPRMMDPRMVDARMEMLGGLGGFASHSHGSRVEEMHHDDGPQVVVGCPSVFGESAEQREKKKRRRSQKLETVIVKSRWACPRDANARARGPQSQMLHCVKCGGQGCDMKVFCGNNKAEEFVFVLSRNDNGSRYPFDESKNSHPSSEKQFSSPAIYT